MSEVQERPAVPKQVGSTREPSAAGWRQHRGLLAGGVAAAFALLVYLVTTYPYVASHDAAEFQTLAATGGIAHAGYPTLVLILKLFGSLPLSTVAFRANLVSVLSGALAVGLAGYLGARLSRSTLAGIGGGMALALTLTMWRESTLAGVHAFTLAIGAAIFLVSIRFAEQPARWRAVGIGLLCGLGLTSHLTILAVFPAVAYAVYFAARSNRFRLEYLPLAAIGLVLGLLPFAYQLSQDVPGRPMNYLEDKLETRSGDYFAVGEVPESRAARSLWLLSARQYLSHGHYRPFSDSGYRLKFLAANLGLNEFPIWGVPIALIGALALWRRRHKVGLMLGVWLAGVLFLVLFGATTPEMVGIFFLPALWVMAAVLAVGLTELRRFWRPSFSLFGMLLVITPVLRVSLIEPPLGSLLPSTARYAWRQWPEKWNPAIADGSWEAYGRGVMRALPEDAVLLCKWEEGMTMRYFRYAEPLREDVTVLLGETENRIRLAQQDAEEAGRPVFFTFYPAVETPIAEGPMAIRNWRRGSLWPAPGAADR